MSAPTEDDDRLGPTADESGSEGASVSDDSGSEDFDDEKGKNGGKSIKDLLDTILDGLRTGTRDFTALGADWERLAAPMGDGNQQNALHLLATPGKDILPKQDDKLESMIKFLVEHRNDLLGKTDRFGYTPLFYAIDNKKENMVRWMCEAHKDINAVLSIRDKDLQNCIHAAIGKKVKFLSFLITVASQDTLAAKDGRGNTPLHLAAEYKKCRKGQLSIVELIASKSDAAVRTTKNGDFNNAGQSPYLYHKATHQEAIDKEKAKEQKDREHTNSTRRPTEDQRNDALLQRRSTGPLPPNMSDMPRVPTHPRAANPGVPDPRLSIQDVPGPRLSIQEGDGNKSGESTRPGLGTSSLPFSHDPPELEPAIRARPRRTDTMDKKTKLSKRSRVNEGTVIDVERFLKLHYLRSRHYNECMEILYGLNTPSDSELYFDLSGYSSMKQHEFENLLSKLKFANVLQYVGIPKITIDLASATGPNKGRIRSGGRSSRSDGAGRVDFVGVFDRLRGKGVTTILKVTVDDTLAPAHSDEAIEDALRGLGVEIWDWKRTDLCSDVIYNVAPKARVVHLYWSGNNSVLRGWAEEGGLKRLEELKEVYLSIQKGLESSVRMNRYVEEFNARMEKLCPQVTICREVPTYRRRTANANALRTAGEQSKQRTQHEWVQCMSDFRMLLLDAEKYYDREAESEKHRRLKESMDTPIRVALIDDGVDVKDLEYTFIGGRTFCTRDEEHNLIHPYYVSSAGHGTVMAKYIYSMCPGAQFYVLRLEDHPHPSEENLRQITAKSAAQAIHAAVRMKVHIISMSWTIDPPEDETEWRELDNAIAKAASENILMFCSASDRGARQTATYPSKAAPNKIFTIGAASAWGAADPRVGSLNNIDLTFPGDKVGLPAAAAPGDVSAIKEASGSSVATALGAGLAALILYCVQVRYAIAQEPDAKNKTRADFERLRKHENMLRAIKDIGTTEKSSYKFVEVWELFGKKVAEKERVRQDKWIELVADIGITLCRKL